MSERSNSYISDTEFEELMAPFLINMPFAVAVSGGVDSMALAFLANRYALKRELKMNALTVDHGLRSESAEEALWVNQTLSKYDIQHEVLLWDHAGTVPKTKLQESARFARYDVLGKWCERNNVDTLLTGHHQDDQIETFFIRLAHQSGLKGLSAMKSSRKVPFGKILRPFLSIPKSRLLATLMHYGLEWRDDPSNEKDVFERVRFRKALNDMYKDGLLSPEPIAVSIQKLQAVDNFLDECVDIFLGAYKVDCFSLKDFQKQHPCLQKRILTAVIRTLSAPIYMPPDDALEHTRLNMMKIDFKGTTIGGLYFKRTAGGIITVFKECRKK